MNWGKIGGKSAGEVFWPDLLTFLQIIRNRDSPVAQTVESLPAMWETQFDPWVRKIPWRRKWQHIPVFSSGKSHGRRSLVGYCP